MNSTFTRTPTSRRTVERSQRTLVRRTGQRGGPSTDDREANQAIAAIQDLSERDAALEDRMSAIQFEINQLATQRKVYDAKIRVHRAVLAPIRILPAEMLAYIFSFLVGSTPRAILPLSHVCKFWNLTSRATRLWSNIVIDAETLGAEQLMRLFLRRSGEAPLRVTFLQSENIGGHWGAWGAVTFSIQRWTSLSITTDDCKAAKRALRSLPAPPRLQDLSVSIRGPCRNPVDELQFGFSPNDVDTASIMGSLAGSCHVRNLEISYFRLPTCGPLFFFLTRLSIVDTLGTLDNPGLSPPILGAELMDVLKFCPNLEEFSFDAETMTSWIFQDQLNDDTTPPSQERILFSRLRTFYLRCHERTATPLLASITAPNLESATLKMLSLRPSTSDNAALNNATLTFLRHCPNLRSLIICGVGGPTTLAAFVSGLSCLESLHLEGSSNPDLVVRGLAGRERFPGHFEHPTWLATKLSTIIINAEPHLLRYTNVFHLLYGRNCGQVDENGPITLRSLVVNGHDMVTEMNSEDFLNFVRTEATRDTNQPLSRLPTLREFFV